MKTMTQWAAVWMALVAATARGQTTKPAERPIPQIARVVLVSIDGCRPDLLLRADTPVIHGLLPKASFSFWARTTAESVTLPSHTSMVTGVTPIHHGIQWNIDLPLAPKDQIRPNYPTMFQLAKKVGYTTAMAAGKSKFVTLAIPGSLDWQWLPAETKTDDVDVTDQAVKMIHDHKPDLLFVHLPTVDNTGHAFGWASAEQLTALNGADRCVGRIMDQLKADGLDGSTAVIITADHGGFGRQHGPDDVWCRYIPWIAVGPGIRQNFDLTTDGALNIDTEDTFCTVCWMLGVPVRAKVDGKPVTEIADKAELMGATGK